VSSHERTTGSTLLDWLVLGYGVSVRWFVRIPALERRPLSKRPRRVLAHPFYRRFVRQASSPAQVRADGDYWMREAKKLAIAHDRLANKLAAVEHVARSAIKWTTSSAKDDLTRRLEEALDA
jgi:hypothetical protein